MSNAYDVVRLFEQAMADYTGSPYAVAVESGSAAIFLSIQWCKHNIDIIAPVEIPHRTYPSVANALVNSGFQVEWSTEEWRDLGYYRLFPLPVIDSAKYLARDMCKKSDELGSNLVCLSFHAKKHIKIGRGGMVLTASESVAEWLKRARFDGRHEVPLDQDTIAFPGFNMYMTPEQAARGLEMMQFVEDGGVLPPDPYLDLSKHAFYN